MENNLNSTSGKNFISFWDYLIDRGLMNENTARALGAASKAILSIEEGWEELDVNNVNVAELIRRFENIHAKDYSPKTLATYGRRFKLALKEYLKYNENPSGYKAPSVKKTSVKKKERPEPDRQSSSVVASYASVYDPSLKLITYPFPLRDDCVVQLRLPTDMTMADVDRLTLFMKSLVLFPKTTE